MKKITIIIIFSTIAALLIWDLLAYFKGGGGATISEVVWFYSKAYPVIPFAGGLLCGHLFLVRSGRPEE